MAAMLITHAMWMSTQYTFASVRPFTPDQVFDQLCDLIFTAIRSSPTPAAADEPRS